MSGYLSLMSRHLIVYRMQLFWACGRCSSFRLLETGFVGGCRLPRVCWLVADKKKLYNTRSVCRPMRANTDCTVKSNRLAVAKENAMRWSPLSNRAGRSSYLRLNLQLHESLNR